MSRNMIRIAWVCLLVSLVAGYAFLDLSAVSGRQLGFLLFLYALGLFSWGYATLRLLVFRRKLFLFLRNLLSGNYETGVRLGPWDRDEIAALGEAANKVAERLRIYDALRAEKVAVGTRLRESIFVNVRDAMVVADMEKEVFEFNPAAKSLFGAAQDTLPFEAVMRKESNRAFAQAWQLVVEKEKVPREVRVALAVSAVASQPVEVSVRIIPLKGKEENVRWVLIVVVATS